jgi:hypothetical protein
MREVSLHFGSLMLFDFHKPVEISMKTSCARIYTPSCVVQLHEIAGVDGSNWMST